MKKTSKLMLSFLFLVMLQVAGVGTINSQAVEKEKYFTADKVFCHTIGNSKVEVCGTTKESGTLKIPEKVVYKGKSYKVTRIADMNIYYQDKAITTDTIDGSSFAIDMPGFHSYQYAKADKFPSKVRELSCVGIQKLILPDTITYIGEGAFCNCRKLSTVQFAKQYKKLVIGRNAFGKNKIKTLTFPKGTIALKDNATGTAMNLVIPATVEKIGAGVVNNSTKKVFLKNKKFVMKNGILYTKGEKTLLGVSGNVFDNVVISAKTTKIVERAFAGSKVTTVTLNDKITELGTGTFYNCKKLTAVKNTRAVMSIGYAAFGSCEILSDVGEMKELKKIDRAAFWKANKLVFMISKKLSDIDIYAFAGTKTTGDMKITVDDGNDTFSIVCGLLVKSEKDKKTVMLQMDKVDDLVISEGITEVAVKLCATKSITYPITLISQQGTVYVPGGSVEYLGNKVPSFGEDYNVAVDNKKVTTVIVPAGCKESYKKAIGDVIMIREDYNPLNDKRLVIVEKDRVSKNNK